MHIYMDEQVKLMVNRRILIDRSFNYGWYLGLRMGIMTPSKLTAPIFFISLFYFTVSVFSESYDYPDDLSNLLSAFEPRPLSPPALTYIPAIGLGTWRSKTEDVCLSYLIHSRRGINSDDRPQMLSNGVLTQDTATSMLPLYTVLFPLTVSPINSC